MCVCVCVQEVLSLTQKKSIGEDLFSNRLFLIKLEK